MKVLHVKLGFLALLFICVNSNVNTCHSEVVWSDDFDDGDYDGWIGIMGQLSAKNGSLHSVVSKTDSFGWPMLSGAYRTSTVTYGTWSFDFLMDGALPEIAVDFLSLGTYKWEMGDEETECYGFYVGGHYPGQVELYKNIKYPESFKLKLVDSHHGSMDDKWYHVDITRGDDGRFCVYVDGFLVIDVVDKQHKESKYFCVHLEYSDRGTAYIDNIVVSDTVDIEPPEREESKGIPGFPVESVSLGVILGVILLLMRNRRL